MAMIMRPNEESGVMDPDSILRWAKGLGFRGGSLLIQERKIICQWLNLQMKTEIFQKSILLIKINRSMFIICLQVTSPEGMIVS